MEAGKQAPKEKNSLVKPLILVAVIVFIIADIVILSPSGLEQPQVSESVNPDLFVPEIKPVFACCIPTDRIPDYSIEKFTYLSAQAGVKQWKLVADRAYFFSNGPKDKLVFAVNVVAYLYDIDDKATVVSGREAKYFMTDRHLEIYGDVVTRFPDGFTMYSGYMEYHTKDRRLYVPDDKPVSGVGEEEGGQITAFRSTGMNFMMKNSEITLPRDVHFTMIRKGEKKGSNAGVSDYTTIDSDHCVIERNIQIAHFTMDPKRPLASRFVHITQPDLFARSRKADMNYGGYDKML
ncbi:MAG: LPS export ABC transporter periplasmic protein LptC, partial [Bdellovibrionales bacterium RIFOXYD1_FULL_53_11]